MPQRRCGRLHVLPFWSIYRMLSSQDWLLRWACLRTIYCRGLEQMKLEKKSKDHCNYPFNSWPRLTVQILHPCTNARQLQCAKWRQAAVFHPDAKPARRAYRPDDSETAPAPEPAARGSRRPGLAVARLGHPAAPGAANTALAGAAFR